MTLLLGFAAGVRQYGATMVLLFVVSLTLATSRSGGVHGFARTAPTSNTGWTTPTDDSSSPKKSALAFHGCSRGVLLSGGSPFVHAARRRHHRYDDDDEEEEDENDLPQVSTGIPQLPAFQSHKTAPATALPQQQQQQPMVASRQFQLQYTCKVCETRNQHTVTRIAYRQGVVIARCKGCDTQHLIADHLGFTGGFPGSSSSTSDNNETRTATIEEHFADGVVNRVSKEVFDLELVLQGHDAKSGSIMVENGELALE